MKISHIPYQTSFYKMLISGVLGVWLHVLIDGIYHWDARVFWPTHKWSLYKLLTQQQIETACLGFFVAAIIVYVVMLVLSYKSRADQTGEKTHN
jgi:membrane-bound metal-dependent hydrolase YbcI (DUF457 family)